MWCYSAWVLCLCLNAQLPCTAAIQTLHQHCLQFVLYLFLRICCMLQVYCCTNNAASPLPPPCIALLSFTIGVRHDQYLPGLRPGTGKTNQFEHQSSITCLALLHLKAVSFMLAFCTAWFMHCFAALLPLPIYTTGLLHLSYTPAPRRCCS